jgi:cytochrome c oxidase subunit II
MLLADVPLWPEQASTHAPRVDALTAFLISLTAFFTIAIFTMVIYFAVKYRRRSPDQVGQRTHGGMRLEITWTVGPLLIALFIFVWGADVYMDYSRVPDNALEVYVVGKQWMWYTQHATGQRQNAGLTVPLGRPIKLTMISQDVIHDFSIPAFRVKQDVVPGRYSTLWFKATKPGKFHLFCAEYCGTNHSRMVGWVTVLEPSRFEEWLQSTAADDSAADQGRKLFQQLHCIACHARGGRGPILENLYRTTVRLEGGGTAYFDDDYIRESILYPGKKIAAGYRDIMPNYRDRVSERELADLIAFIRSLRTGDTPPRTEDTPAPAKAPPAPQPGPKEPNP